MACDEAVTNTGANSLVSARITHNDVIRVHYNTISSFGLHPASDPLVPFSGKTWVYLPYTLTTRKEIFRFLLAVVKCPDDSYVGCFQGWSVPDVAAATGELSWDANAVKASKMKVGGAWIAAAEQPRNVRGPAN